MLTVRDLLQDLDLRLLSGEAGVDAPVRWVHISELVDPTPWLSGGELLLSTGMQLENEVQAGEYISRLADHQLAGLGFGTGFAHPEVPAPLLEVARERDFPVFEVPYALPFIAITEAAFSQLVNEQYAVLRRALAAHERLERLVLSQRGLEAVAGAIATTIGGAALVFDPRGELIAHHSFRRRLAPARIDALAAEVRERTRRREGRAFAPGDEDGPGGLALPVVGDGGAPPRDGAAPGRMPDAWLVVLKDAGPLSDFDRLASHQAVTIVALELLRRRVAGDTERRLAGDVLAAMIRGDLAGEDLIRRLRPFGLGEEVGALVVEVGGMSRSAVGEREAALSGAVRDEAVPALVASLENVCCALVAGTGDEELFALAGRVSKRLSGPAATVRVGVGRAAAAGEARRSFHEARCALEAVCIGLPSGQDGNGSGPHAVATYRDLGSFQLLLSLQDGESLRLFCDSILGPIEASEGPYGGELVRSLEAFIEENGQWERAARRLYCHRHTLRYRIRRVEELTGRDLGSARDRIEFWLALRGRQLVS